MSAEHSPERGLKQPAAFSTPTQERYFSMKLAICRSNCSPSFCEFSRNRNLRGLAATERYELMFALWQPRITICTKWYESGGFARDFFFRSKVFCARFHPCRGVLEKIPLRVRTLVVQWRLV